jgi:hypothetical protein
MTPRITALLPAGVYAAAHLAGYATLLGFILYRERARKHQAA